MNEHDPSARNDELVSAYLDGEATAEERAIVDASPALRARVAQFAEGQHQVGAEVTIDHSLREVHIAAALAEAGHPQVVTPLARARDRRQLTRISLAAAAAVVVVGLAVPMLRDLGSSSDDTASINLQSVAETLDPDAGTATGGADAGSSASGDDTHTAEIPGDGRETTGDDAPPAEEAALDAAAAAERGAVTLLGSFADTESFVVAVRAALAGDSIVDERATNEDLSCVLEAMDRVGDLDLAGSAVIADQPVIFAVGHGDGAAQQLVALAASDCSTVVETVLSDGD